MKLFNDKIKMVLVAFFAVFILVSCKKDDANNLPTENLDAKISANSNLSIFQAALVKTRLDNFTKGGGPFTIWAPNNDAFKKIGINSAMDLNAIDSNLLVQIITYHIQATSRSYNEIPQGPNATMPTQSGFQQYASRKVGGSAFINGQQVVEPNILTSNGYLHIIDGLLIPPINVGLYLSLNTNYKLMLQAFTKTGTVITINPLTIFAVPNNVMIATGYDSTTIANATGAALTTLTSIMKYHTVNKRIFTPDFVAGALKTVQGTNVIVASTATELSIKGTSNPTAFQLSGGNLLTTTGVIHFITGLLKP